MAKVTRMKERQDLPKRLTVRKFTNTKGEVSFNYYYELPRDEDGKRRCIPLGNLRDVAIESALEMNAVAEEEEPVDMPSFFLGYFGRLRKNACIRKIPFFLTLDDLLEMYRRSNGVCEVSGIKFSLNKHGDWRARPWVPSVDRIDTKGPYVNDNCRLVCYYVNQAINEFGLETFIHVCRKVAATTSMAKSSVRHNSKNGSGHFHQKPHGD